MSDPLPTILAGPTGDKLKDSVDRITLFGRPLLDPGDQQSIDRGQLLAGLITLLSRSLGHCATSLQQDWCCELASRDRVKVTGRGRYSRSIQSEVGSCCPRGIHVCGPAVFFGRGSAEGPALPGVA
jgi:hypothetical protein